MSSPAKNISFKFKNDTSEADVVQGLDAVNRMAGIFNTEALFQDNPSPVLKLMYVSRVSSDVDQEDVMQQIKLLPNIEYAHTPAERKPL